MLRWPDFYDTQAPALTNDSDDTQDYLDPPGQFPVRMDANQQTTYVPWSYTDMYNRTGHAKDNLKGRGMDNTI